MPMPLCHDCHTTITQSNAGLGSSCRFICRDCIPHGWHVCTNCGLVFRNREPRRDNQGRPVCRSCFETSECSGCHEHFYRDDTVSAVWFTTNNARFCAQCTPNHTFACDHCGYRRPLSQRTIHAGHSLCDCCSDEYIVRPGIHCSSYKPEPQMLGTGKLFLGFELELETKDTDESESTQADRLKDMVPSIYCKSDGSLNNGFEIVSMPFSFEWLKENSAFLDPIWQLADKCQSLTDRRCGFHIHMSKDAFSQVHLFRFLKFFYSQKDLIRFLAQRVDIERLERWAPLNTRSSANAPLRALSRKAKRNEVNESRYQAVNLCNKHTIELRVFQGALNPYVVFKNIEAAHAIYKFTKSTTIARLEGGEKSLADFYEFVAGKQQEYPHLASFLCDRMTDTLKEGIRSSPGYIIPANFQSDRPVRQLSAGSQM